MQRPENQDVVIASSTDFVSRRRLVLAGLAVPALPISTSDGAVRQGPATLHNRAETVQAVTRPAVVYVGAWDCPPCRVWEQQHLAAWERSRARRYVNFIIVRSDRIAQAMDDVWWPAGLRPLRNSMLDVLRQQGQNWATPTFMLWRRNNNFQFAIGLGTFERDMLVEINDEVFG